MFEPRYAWRVGLRWGLAASAGALIVLAVVLVLIFGGWVSRPILVGMSMYLAAPLLVMIPLACRRRLRRRLIEVDSQLCTRCGYDLRGTPEGPCPECGRFFSNEGNVWEWRRYRAEPRRRVRWRKP